MSNTPPPAPSPQREGGASTVDAAEIAKFSAIAAEWWDQEGKFKPLHQMNPARLAFIREVALQNETPPLPSRGEGRVRGASPATARGKPLRGLRILDIGCGGGLVSVPLARLGAEVTGVDASPETIEAAKTHAREIGLDIDFRVGAAEELTESFDLVLALEIVEHVADVGAFLQACAKLVRPGGKLIVSTINRTARARTFAIVGAERFLKWAPEGTHEYEKLVAPEELVAGAPDLRWAAPVGLSFDPIARSWKLSDDVSMNYFRVAMR
ncbi:MAG: bifunctional 2-polyprenyl-6-hydroxyphenol methylase/3-demethylubiquinol 3-O-methyltransferase UbiG [Hyphomonadaceae bacterium]|nr:bifunctional 2-polyprenyl-6-hydroxyphenol methylase/3-demethylubiquinol 3-O-methyltransferase UbiG [Hyphomonadaceae bacterium]